jgi:hypothetical protein
MFLCFFSLFLFDHSSFFQAPSPAESSVSQNRPKSENIYAEEEEEVTSSSKNA